MSCDTQAPRSSGAGTLIGLLVRHYDELVEYVRLRFEARGVAPRAFANEVVHDVCVRLLERPEPVAVKLPLALLRRISHDMAVDRCRAEDSRRRWVESTDVLPDAACPAADQARQLEQQQELQRLIEVVRAMPLRRQQVFVLHKIHELPQAEVAQRMGISLKMVEKHLRLAMTECRRQLRDIAA